MNEQPMTLDSPRWSQLRHCYGPATDTPGLLRDREAFPDSHGQTEPWFTLWGSLCHQGDIYPASFAAVPHIVRVLATDPKRATYGFFLLPACVEIARIKKGVRIPDHLEGPYLAAIRRLPSLAGLAATKEWSVEFLGSALAAMAVDTGHATIGEAALELNEMVAQEFLAWFHNR
jgi:hypothetical protein